MKPFIKNLLLAVVFVSMLHFFKHPILEAGITYGMHHFTGLQMSIGRLGANMLRADMSGEGSIAMRDVFLRNPSIYEEPVFLRIKRIHGRYYLKPLAQGRVHMKTLHLYIKEFHVIRNRQGQINLSYVRSHVAEGDRFVVDSLKVEVEKFIFKDYLPETGPVLYEVEGPVQKNYRSIKGVDGLGEILHTLITAEEIEKYFPEPGSGGSGEDLLSRTQDAVLDALESLEDRVNNLKQSLPDKTKATVRSMIGLTGTALSVNPLKETLDISHDGHGVNSEH